MQRTGCAKLHRDGDSEEAPLRTDDLIVLLEIARCGSFLKAAAALGLDHSTVSRRIAALERELKSPLVHRGVQGCTLTAMGQRLLKSCEQVESAVHEVRMLSGLPEPGPGELNGLLRIATGEAFGTFVVTPVLARLHRENPGLQIEIITQTRPSPYGVGADIEIGVGDPVRNRAGAEALTDYRLGLYASGEYLRARGTPRSTSELAEHPLIYYIEGLLRVEDLDVLDRFGTDSHAAFGSTSVHAQLEATVHGAGIGLLPAFVAERDRSLVRVLFDEVAVVPTYHVCLATGRLRRPAAAAVMADIRAEVRSRQAELLPHR